MNVNSNILSPYQIKLGFFKRISDYTIFNCYKFNITKTVLSSLVYKWADKKKFRAYVLWPISAYYLIMILKHIRYIFLNKNQAKIDLVKDRGHKKVLLLDEGRIGFDELHQEKSLYFENIKECIGAINILHLTLNANNKFNHDFNVIDIRNHFGNRIITTYQIRLLKKLKATFRNVKKTSLFNDKELDHIRLGIQLFFLDFQFWDNFLSQFKLKTIIIINNFGKEGLIFAAKKHKIKVIEIQHGVIIKESVPYIFNLPISKAEFGYLFPDKFLSYGQHWKNVLLSGTEYGPSQIEIIGDSTYKSAQLENHEISNISKLSSVNKIIMIAGQYNLHESFLTYLKSILPAIKSKNIVIVIKPHPFEDNLLYNSILIKNKIIISNLPITSLFKITDFFISSYSTTCFEAYMHDIPCFCIKSSGFENYTESILSTGIAQLLNLGKLPGVPSTNLALQKKDIFYSKFNSDLLLKTI